MPTFSPRHARSSAGAAPEYILSWRDSAVKRTAIVGGMARTGGRRRLAAQARWRPRSGYAVGNQQRLCADVAARALEALDAAEQADTRMEEARVEGFDDVIVGARLEARDFVLDVRAGGEEHDR